MRVLETRLGLTLLRAHFPHAAFLRDIPPEAPLATLLPMSAEDLLEAGALIYLRGLGFPTGPGQS